MSNNNSKKIPRHFDLSADDIIKIRKGVGRAKLVAKYMDHYQLDAITGLVPIGGDLVSIIPAVYIVYEGVQMGMPRAQVIKMIANIGIDLGAGMLPVIGMILDFIVRNNKKNAVIIEDYFNQVHIGILDDEVDPVNIVKALNPQ
ncbi:MAG: DUF4112 domain-containing protein [Leptospiraceae bacterium]|nr:DUF4112 domain-containing protein [Leptospiraceae bacterium]